VGVLIGVTGRDGDALVRQHCRPATVDFVPEIQLQLASQLLPLWQATEQAAGTPLPPPFWAFAWPGSLALARYLIDTPELIRGRRVLDFGSGSGLAAIAAVRAGAARVGACDIDPLACLVQQLNAALNRVSFLSATVDVTDTTAAFLETDVVLAGDVCYEREPAERTLTWFSSLVASGVDVLLADPGRHYAPQDHLRLLATYNVPTLYELESTTSKRTRLWRLLPTDQG
jgi:predicted nicotinamide N-methyase